MSESARARAVEATRLVDGKSLDMGFAHELASRSIALVDALLGLLGDTIECAQTRSHVGVYNDVCTLRDAIAELKALHSDSNGDCVMRVAAPTDGALENAHHMTTRLASQLSALDKGKPDVAAILHAVDPVVKDWQAFVRACGEARMSIADTSVSEAARKLAPIAGGFEGGALWLDGLEDPLRGRGGLPSGLEVRVESVVVLHDRQRHEENRRRRAAGSCFVVCVVCCDGWIYVSIACVRQSLI